MMQVKINSFEDLIEFIERPEITKNQTAKLLRDAMTIWTSPYDTKEEIIQDLKTYWERNSHTYTKNTPTILGNPLNDY